MAFLVNPPCVIFEDDHVLVVDKPPGINTHAPRPRTGEGLFEWLRDRESRWAGLSIHHRLDKETSGLLIFGKNPEANRILATQFEQQAVKKTYVLLTDREPAALRDARSATAPFIARSCLVRAGTKYLSRPIHPGGLEAETRFRVLDHHVTLTPRRPPRQGPIRCWLLEAQPVTGRTHQIRVHAAAHGFPVLGDTLYGGTPSDRLCLHASQLSIRLSNLPGKRAMSTPESLGPRVFESAPRFGQLPSEARVEALIHPDETSTFRLVHGAADNQPGWYADKLGPYVLTQSEQARADNFAPTSALAPPIQGLYHKTLTRHVRKSDPVDASPQRVSGQPAPESFVILENGLRFELSFNRGYSTGLFLDQRDNRRRMLTGHVAAGFDLPQGVSKPPTLLNTFAYTCAFSVCGARAGFTTTSLDLSRNYLDWGRRNFRLNDLDPDKHDFIYGDVFHWMRRLSKKGRKFDLIVLDPPTFSQSKESGVFRAEKDYGRLVRDALELLDRPGILFASTNAARLDSGGFVAMVEQGVRDAKRVIRRSHYAPQPPDFPITRAEPAHLNTFWLEIS